MRAFLEPFRHGDRLAALRARVFAGQVFGLQSARTDSDHDASPFCDLARKIDASNESLSRRRRVAILSNRRTRPSFRGARSANPESRSRNAVRDSGFARQRRAPRNDLMNYFACGLTAGSTPCTAPGLRRWIVAMSSE